MEYQVGEPGPYGITVGPDDAVWFVAILAGQVGRITVGGDITEFPLPDRTARPHAIAAGPDGHCWFTEWGSGRVGRIGASGAIDGFALPNPASEPHGIAVAPDGTVWVALEIGAIGALKLLPST